MKKAKSRSEGHQYHTGQSAERSWLELRRFSSSVSWAEKLLAYRLSSSASEVIEEEEDLEQNTSTGTTMYQDKEMSTTTPSRLDTDNDKEIKEFSNMTRFYPERKLQYRRNGSRLEINHDGAAIRSLHEQGIARLAFQKEGLSANHNKREYSLHHRQLWCEDPFAPTMDSLSISPRQSIIVQPHPNIQDLDEKPLPPSPTSTYSQDSIDDSNEWTTNLKSYWSDDSDSSDEEGELTVTQERLSRKLQSSHDDFHLSQRVISTWKGLKSRKMSVPNLRHKSNDQQLSPKSKMSPPIPTIRTYPPSTTTKHSSMPRPEMQRFPSSSSFKQKRVNLSEVHISPPKEWRGLRDL